MFNCSSYSVRNDIFELSETDSICMLLRSYRSFSYFSNAYYALMSPPHEIDYLILFEQYSPISLFFF